MSLNFRAHPRFYILAILVVGIFVASVSLLAWYLRSQTKDEKALAFKMTLLEQAPCLAGVCPGSNYNREQVVDILSQGHLVRRSIEQGESLVGLSLSADISGRAKGSGGNGGIYFNIDEGGEPRGVRRISLRVFDLELGTIIEALGEPDALLFVSGCGIDGNYIHASLLYMDRGVQVAVGQPVLWPGRTTISDNTPVESIEFYAPEAFDDHMMEALDWYIVDNIAINFLDSSVTKEDFMQQIHPWPGLDSRPTPTADFCPR